MPPGVLNRLKNTFKEQKGWPVGIPISKRIGKALVNKGYCKWAPPIWPLYKLNTTRPMVSVRCTTIGELYAKGKLL